MVEKIKMIFQETLNGPKDLSHFKDDFVNGYEAIPDIKRELDYFAVDAKDPSLIYSSETFLNFIAFNSKSEAVINYQK
jgi:hypothetical protein